MSESSSLFSPFFDRPDQRMHVQEHLITLLLLATLISSAWTYLVVMTPPIFPLMPNYDNPPMAAVRPLVAFNRTLSTAFGDVSEQGFIRSADLRLFIPILVSPYHLPDHLLLWLALLTGIMLPTVMPTLFVYCHITTSGHPYKQARELVGPVFLFTFGYLFVWTVMAVVGLLVQVLFSIHAERALFPLPTADQHVTISSGVLLLAGLYQFTTWKETCLHKCRSPIRVFLAPQRTRRLGVLFMGIRNGLYHLGYCWALIAVLYAVGVGNMLCIALLSILILVEKVWKYGQQARKVSGVGFIVWGVVVLLYHFS